MEGPFNQSREGNGWATSHSFDAYQYTKTAKQEISSMDIRVHPNRNAPRCQVLEHNTLYTRRTYAHTGAHVSARTKGNACAVEGSLLYATHANTHTHTHTHLLYAGHAPLILVPYKPSSSMTGCVTSIPDEGRCAEHAGLLRLCANAGAPG